MVTTVLLSLVNVGAVCLAFWWGRWGSHQLLHHTMDTMRHQLLGAVYRAAMRRSNRNMEFSDSLVKLVEDELRTAQRLPLTPDKMSA